MSRHRSGAWLGAYPATDDDSSDAGSIWWVPLGPDGAPADPPERIIELASPSFLALHPTRRVLYAVSEEQGGRVYALGVEDPPDQEAPGAEVLAEAGSGGAGPCHLMVSPGASKLYVANYVSGTVAVIGLDEDGSFAAPTSSEGPGPDPHQVFQHHGQGAAPSRQEAPHAHSCTLAPDGMHLLACDLGIDRIVVYSLGPDESLSDTRRAMEMPAGSGPRHLAVSASGKWLLVTGELDCRLHVLEWDPDSGDARHRGAVALPGAPEAAPSHVVVEGPSVHVAVRGSDVLATFDLDEQSGTLSEKYVRRSGESWPRHFASVGGTVLVANQDPGSLVALSPSGTMAEYPVPSLAMVLPDA